MGKCHCYVFTIDFEQVFALGEQVFQLSYVTKQLIERDVFHDLGPLHS